MGIIKQGILGGFSGKVGGVVGTSWKGKAVIKARPLSVSNPRTAGQVAQRSKMSNVAAFAALLLATVIQPLWNRFAQSMSGYNAFCSENISLFASPFASVASSLVISKGKMGATSFDEATTETRSSISIGWLDDSGEGYKLGTDLAYAVVVNETQGTVDVSSGVALRSSGVLDIDHTSVLGDTIHAYLAFKRADGTVVSDTAYSAVEVL